MGDVGFERPALGHLDALIGCLSNWALPSSEQYYLTHLVPSIISGNYSELTAVERERVAALRAVLTNDEWSDLSELMRRRRGGELIELAADRELVETQLRARREEAARLAEIAAAEAALAERRVQVLNRLTRALDTDFLNARQRHAADHDRDLVTALELETFVLEFVRNWAQQQLGLKLDPDQAAAVAAVDGNVQIVARAGSGKTRTLVTRALFLLLHCGVSPREILLLAFNKKAAREMRDRIDEKFDGELPHVMTFHALAYALVHPDEKLIYDDRDADQLGLSREIQEVIDEHVRSTRWGPLIKELMLAHFKEDWERLARGGFHLSREQFLSRRRALTSESLKGDLVKSFGERLIANTLFEHGVPYAYESSFPWSGVNYRPDFTIRLGDGRGVVVEYFGLAGSPDYDEMSADKRTFWAGYPRWSLIELTPNDLQNLGETGFAELLLGRLAQLGVAAERLDDDEIWALTKDRAIDRFTEAMESFVGRCRKQELGSERLAALIRDHVSLSPAEGLFLEVAPSIYSGYVRLLSVRAEEDFSGLMWRAVEVVNRGQTEFVRDKGRERGDLTRLRFVMIDEFQDFSQMFSELTSGVLSVSPQARVCCVGDDWQAINGFAGSDLKYFQNFDNYFANATRRHLKTNYRSGPRIVEVGNALMHGLGEASVADRDSATSVRTWLLEDFTPTASEKARHRKDHSTPAVLRLVNAILERDLDVVMLSRRNTLPRYLNYPDRRGRRDRLNAYLEHVRSHLPPPDRSRISISTTHKYKGLESGGVIVLDAVTQTYPLIHPNWVFQRVFGETIDNIEAEERRLFYVALTRAHEDVALLTGHPGESLYLEEIGQHTELEKANWSDLAPAPPLDDRAFIEIRVHDGRNVQDKLENKDYEYSPTGKYWSKFVPEQVFSISALQQQDWMRAGYSVSIHDEHGECLREL